MIFLQRTSKKMGKIEFDAIWQDRDIRFDVNTECVEVLCMKKTVCLQSIASTRR